MESNIEKLLTDVGTWLASGEARRTPECLDDNLVAGYVAGSLSSGEKSHAERHLGSCRYCFGHVVEIQNVLTMHELGLLKRPSPEPLMLRVLEKAIEIITHTKEKFEGSFKALTPAAAAATWGDPERWDKTNLIAVTVSNIQLEIIAEKYGDSIRLRMFLSDAETHRERSGANVRVLGQDGTLIAEAMTDSDGEVSLDHIPLGEYEIEI
jgi:uncharacterized surface anchored protein